MVLERPLELGHDVRAQARLSHQHDSFPVVAEPPQVLALGLVERRG
jgi:hypothetical protein